VQKGAKIQRKVLNVPKTKVCTKCGKRKKLEAYYADTRNKDGKQSRCKVCWALAGRVFRSANTALLAARAASYYRSNGEKVRARVKAYRTNNKDIVKARKAKYYRKNRTKIAERAAAYRNRPAVRERLRTYFRAYRATHSPRIRAHRAAYYTANRAAIRRRAAARRSDPAVRERYLEYTRRWRRLNREYANWTTQQHKILRGVI
jgi:hypothetical protein